MQQQTLNEALHFEGIGLHTGLHITMTLQPAPINTGYQIRRTDVENAPLIPALAELVCSTDRSTVLKKGELSVSTIEHTLSALYALGVDTHCRGNTASRSCRTEGRTRVLHHQKKDGSK